MIVHPRLSRIQEAEGQSVKEALVSRPSAPVLFRGEGRDWPALHKWTREFLAGLGEDLPVTLVEGDRERAAPRFVPSTFGAFCRGADRPGLYLKEFDLFEEFPGLKEDIDLSALAAPLTFIRPHAYIRSAGSVTWMHYHAFDNFLCHITGQKTLFLLDRRYGPAVPKSPKFGAFTRIGDMDLSSPLAVRALGCADLAASVITYDMAPGDIVYIPAGWWHQISNRSFCISMSGFVVDPAAMLMRLPGEMLRKWAHDMGLYRRGNCSCHAE
jgi:hypothetical protein